MTRSAADFNFLDESLKNIKNLRHNVCKSVSARILLIVLSRLFKVGISNQQQQQQQQKHEYHID